jgi:hypothetical protein
MKKPDLRIGCKGYKIQFYQFLFTYCEVTRKKIQKLLMLSQFS